MITEQGCKFQAQGTVKNTTHTDRFGMKTHRAEITFRCLLCGGVKKERISYPVRRCVK